MLPITKKYLEFKNRHKKFFKVSSTLLTIFVWTFFIFATIVQIYFNVVPFEQAIEDVNQATTVDVNQIFTVEENIFFNLTLVNLYKSLFDVIFLSSAIVAFIGTWVLSQGRALWEAFLLFLTLALPRVRREWGLIFDKETGKPIELAIVRLYGKEGESKKFINQSVADLDGRYRIYLPEKYDKFIIEVTAPNYTPVFKEISRWASSANFYASEISLSATGEEVQEKLSLKKIKTTLKQPITYLVFILSTIVTIHSTYGVLAIPQIDTYIFFFLYGIAWVWNIRVMINRKRKIEGKILSKSSDQPVAGVFLRLFDLDKQLLAKEVTDSAGIVNFKVEPGVYLMQVSRKNIKSISDEFIEVEINTKGYLTKDVSIDVTDEEISSENIPNPFS